MLELLAGMDAARRATERALALEPTKRPRPTRSRRPRAATARAFVFGAVVALASPGARTRPASSARRTFREAGAD